MIYIVILNWNNAVDTINCVRSVAKLQNAKFHIVLCDNASSDGSFSKIKQAFGCGQSDNRGTTSTITNSGPQPVQLTLIQTGSNLGFAGGNNVGLRFALAQPNMTHAWLLNNDTEVDPAALLELLKTYQSDDNIGICGSRLLYYDRRDRIQALGGTYNKALATTSHCYANRNADAKVDEAKLFDDIDYVVGASMLVSREFLETVGLMGEDFFLYFEELDWAIRARRFNYKLCVSLKSVVFHKEGGTINKGKQRRSLISEYYFLRNRLRITRRYYPLFLPTVWLAGWLIALKRLSKGHFAHGRIAVKVLFGLK